MQRDVPDGIRRNRQLIREDCCSVDRDRGFQIRVSLGKGFPIAASVVIARWVEPCSKYAPRYVYLSRGWKDTCGWKAQCMHQRRYCYCASYIALTENNAFREWSTSGPMSDTNSQLTTSSAEDCTKEDERIAPDNIEPRTMSGVASLLARHVGEAHAFVLAAIRETQEGCTDADSRDHAIVFARPKVSSLRVPESDGGCE